MVSILLGSGRGFRNETRTLTSLYSAGCNVMVTMVCTYPATILRQQRVKFHDMKNLP